MKILSVVKNRSVFCLGLNGELLNDEELCHEIGIRYETFLELLLEYGGDASILQQSTKYFDHEFYDATECLKVANEIFAMGLVDRVEWKPEHLEVK